MHGSSQRQCGAGGASVNLHSRVSFKSCMEMVPCEPLVSVWGYRTSGAFGRSLGEPDDRWGALAARDRLVGAFGLSAGEDINLTKLIVTSMRLIRPAKKQLVSVDERSSSFSGPPLVVKGNADTKSSGCRYQCRKDKD